MWRKGEQDDTLGGEGEGERGKGGKGMGKSGRGKEGEVMQYMQLHFCLFHSTLVSIGNSSNFQSILKLLHSPNSTARQLRQALSFTQLYLMPWSHSCSQSQPDLPMQHLWRKNRKCTITSYHSRYFFPCAAWLCSVLGELTQLHTDPGLNTRKTYTHKLLFCC